MLLILYCKSSGERFSFSSTSEATPATTAAEAEVPLLSSYPPPSFVDSTPTPGASRSSRGSIFDRLATLSFSSTAPTDVTFVPQAGALRYALPSFPLAATAKIPWETAKFASSVIIFESQ